MSSSFIGITAFEEKDHYSRSDFWHLVEYLAAGVQLNICWMKHEMNEWLKETLARLESYLWFTVSSALPVYNR